MLKDWIQVMILAVTVVGGVWYLSIDIEGVRHDSIHQIDMLSARLAADEEKIAGIKDVEAGHFAEEVSARSTVQQTLNTILGSVSDLRVEVAKKTNTK